MIYLFKDIMTKNELVSLAKNLNKKYNPYLMDFQIWDLLDSLLPDEKYRLLIKNYGNKISAHKLVNDIIMQYCPGERIIKYNFVKKYINKTNEITLFEMNIDNSRIDIGRVNGKSIGYEIKTEFDSVKRLKKQIDDYSKVFEYIYIICHPIHLDNVKKIAPEHCGIITYKLDHGICKFATKRKALKNKCIDPMAQVRNLTSDDLRVILKKVNFNNIPSTRKMREELIYNKCDERKINSMFKYAIKNRYNKQWDFICNNFNNIMPIDIQSFFHRQIDPQNIYFNCSAL